MIVLPVPLWEQVFGDKMTRINYAQIKTLQGLPLQNWYITDSIRFECGNEFLVFKYEDSDNFTGFIDVEGDLKVHWDYSQINVNYFVGVLEKILVSQRT